MLHGKEDPVDLPIHACLDKKHGRTGDDVEPGPQGFGVADQVLLQYVRSAQVLGLRQRIENGLNDGNGSFHPPDDFFQTGQLFPQKSLQRVENFQPFPIGRFLDDVSRKDPRPFGVPFPYVLGAPVLQAEGGGRCDLDQIQVVFLLEGDRRIRQRRRILVVDGEVPPQPDRDSVRLFAGQDGAHAFRMGKGIHRCYSRD